MQATDEQLEAIEAFHTGDALRINAFAGTGKTTTLEMLSKQSTRRGMYLAFNKSIASEAQARFASSVACSTVHSLAYRATSSVYKQGEKMTGRFNANALVQEYNLKDWVVDDHRITARSQAHLALKALRHFMQSDREIVDLDHVPILGRMKVMSDELVKEIQHTTQRRAEKLWKMMREPGHHMPLGHDGYLKLWALGRPRLATDYIMLDEAQDTNLVVLGVLENQASQVVYVGDRHQQIYAWRGAINAMDRIQTPHQTNLTTSFRFGPEIAGAATSILRQLGEPLSLRGNPQKQSFLSARHCRAILARTNASVIATVIEKMSQGYTVHVVGGVNEIVRMLEAAGHLKQGRPSDLPEFFGFSNWKEVVEFSKTDEGEELRTFVSLVEQHNESRLIMALRATTDSEGSANLIVSTAHKAKGREWDTVELLDDFLKSRARDENGDPRPMDPEEVRLFYVALTRARVAVEVSPAALAMFEIEPTSALPGGGGATPTGSVLSLPDAEPVRPDPVRQSVTDRTRSPKSVRQSANSVRPRTKPAIQAQKGLLERYWWLLLIAAGVVIGKML